ncbi:MAG: pantoate--beta-alanine ligase [Myxococcota bacterium]
MQVIRTVSELVTWRNAQRAAGRRIGFVPTMGYLHDGHLALCRTARPEVACLAASIFVNPLQFGPTEDLSRYPRDEAGDLAKLASVGVDMVFLPTPEEMYPAGFATQVSVEGLTEGLCGASRPGHFAGVTTVVCKLFNLMGAQAAYFGLKDYQQFKVIEKLVQDLCMDVQVFGVPTVREADGLAMSSRNAYLSAKGRQAAVVLSRALSQAERLYQAGERHPETLEAAARAVIAQEPLAVVEYVEVVDADTLQRPKSPSRLVMALAVKVEKTRLIDNRMLGG